MLTRTSRMTAAVGSMALLLLLLGLCSSSSVVEARPSTHADWLSALPYNVSTVLKDYCASVEDVYSWEELPQFQEKGIGFTSYVLNVTSLRWLDDTKVSRSIWWHFVVLFVPDEPEPRFLENGFLYITGSSNNDARPPPIDSLEDWLPQLMLVGYTKQVVATIWQVPNAPVLFFEEKPFPKSRREDDIVAWTWKHFLEDSSDPTFLVRLPMVKSSIAAMNATTEFMSTSKSLARAQTLRRWIVAGASKRGWTTWLVGAVDPRVIGIVPLVMDELNFVKNIHHHYRAYGGWSFALAAYASLNLTGHFDDPLLQVLMDIEDPANYLSNTALADIPKLVLSAGGDQFFLPDDIDYFWDDMKGESHFRLMPNLEHSMAGNPVEVTATAIGFALQVQMNQTRPRYSWEVSPLDGTLTLTAEEPFPSSVQLWYSPTIDGDKRRDWRLATCPDGCPNPGAPVRHNVTWFQGADPVPTTRGNERTYSARVEPPAEGEGWVAFVLQITWKDPVLGDFKVSTGPSILPQTFPYPNCEGEECLAGYV